MKKDTIFSNMDIRSNNLKVLKFIAAILVIYSHAFIITGKSGEPLGCISSGEISLSSLAVALFFFASGFFVTKSLMKDGTGKKYWLKRIVRIYPAFIVIILLTAFVLGPVVTEYSLASYFQSKSLYSYLLYLCMIPKYELPGVFTHNPESIVNGSLWTLILEIICYFGLYVTFSIGILNKKVLKKVNIIFGVIVFVVFGLKLESIYQFHEYLRPMFVFIIGMEYYIFCEDIKLSYKGFILVSIISILLLILKRGDLFTVLCFPYLISNCIFSKKQISSVIAKCGDLSYSVYLAAFPIQQTLVQYFPDMGVVRNTIFASILAIVVAYLMFKYVEQYSIKCILKK